MACAARTKMGGKKKREQESEADRLKRANSDLARMMHGFEGAAVYVEAVARGDVASKPDMKDRRGKCSVCSAKCNASTLGLAPSSFCGLPLVDNTDDPVPGNRTCGCAIFFLTMVASKACPRWDPEQPDERYWGPVKRRRRALE